MKTTHAVKAETTIDGVEWRALVHFEWLGAISPSAGAEGQLEERPIFAAMLTRNGEALPDWYKGEGKPACTIPGLGGLDARLLPLLPTKIPATRSQPPWMSGMVSLSKELRRACGALSKEIHIETLGEVRDLTIYPMNKGELYSRLVYLDAITREVRPVDYHGAAVETFQRLFGAAEHALQWGGWRGAFPWRIGVRGGQVYVAIAPWGNNPYPRQLGHEKTAPVSLGLFPAIHAALEAHVAEHLLEAAKGVQAPGLLPHGQRLDQAPAPVLANVRAYAVERVGAAMSVATPAELYAWFDRLLPHEQHDFHAALHAR